MERKAQLLLLGLVGGILGVLVVRGFFLDPLQEVGWRLFWAGLAEGRLSEGDMEMVVQSATFAKCVAGFVIGSLAFVFVTVFARGVKEGYNAQSTAPPSTDAPSTATSHNPSNPHDQPSQPQVQQRVAEGFHAASSALSDVVEKPQVQQALESSKTALGDALEAARYVFSCPISRLPEARARLSTERAIGAGVVFASVFALGLAVAVHGALPEWEFQPSIGNTLLLLIGGLVTAAGMTGLLSLARRRLGSEGDLGDDCFAAGMALLPVGGAAFLVGLVGLGSVAVVLGLFAGCYSVLILYGGCRHIADLPEKVAVPIVPAILALSVWLSRVVFSTIIG